MVDTIGFTPDTAMGPGFGVRHSQQMRIVERIWLEEPDLLAIETTIHDPEALTEPLTKTAVFGRHSDCSLAEYVCQQNNRNSFSADGKAVINLEYSAD